MKVVEGADDSLLVDISDALSERDRVRFTVHTRTKLAKFAKPVMSVVRQHEEFIWLHDCLEDNDQYAGYIIPPPPPRPDFDASREKLQRLGDGETNMSKEEFAKMKQELEAEYLAIFKKTVAMHEMFLQRLAAHEKFRDDNNFKIFLEYENELAVRSKSKKERLAGSIHNIGKSLTDFVITTSQVAATTSSASTAILAGHSPTRRESNKQPNGNISSNLTIQQQQPLTTTQEESTRPERIDTAGDQENGSRNFNNNDGDEEEDIDEQYFEKERLYLALYHNSIRETAIQADKVSQVQKLVADNYLQIAQQLVKLASIEVLPITNQTKDASSFVACPLPSLTLPTPSTSSSALLNEPASSSSNNYHHESMRTGSGLSSTTSSEHSTNKQLQFSNDTRALADDDDDLDNLLNEQPSSSSSVVNIYNNNHDSKSSDIKKVTAGPAVNNSGSSLSISEVQPSGSGFNKKSTGGCANEPTSENLKRLLMHVSDYLEQARKLETRIASDEDLKLTDTFLYYKRDTVAAQDLLIRRLRFMAEYETATRNLEKARQKGRTQMQYADVIQKQAKENFISISKLAKQELIDYKQRRVASFKRAFSDLVELELKHLRSHSQLLTNCLNTCRGISSSNTK